MTAGEQRTATVSTAEIEDRSAIPLSSANLGEHEQSVVAAALAAGWISGTGPFVTRFEERISRQVGREYTIAVANGTMAIELALRALQVGAGDEVIVPALTFIAPATSVLAVGATPVIVDVTPDSWTLSPADAASNITARTKAIIAVDVFGHPADYDELTRFGVPVIEDAAEAHGARYKGRPAGSMGDISIFSFHANKAVTTGEGGCACTDSAELAERMRTIANHGTSERRSYTTDLVGRNYRMANLTAALGVAQMDRWDELVTARNRVSALYTELLADTGCGTRPIASWAEYSCWLHTVTAERREPVIRELRRGGIDARAIWPALSEQPVLAERSARCPVAEEVSRRAFWLPTFAGIVESDIRRIVDVVRAVSMQLVVE